MGGQHKEVLFTELDRIHSEDMEQNKMWGHNSQRKTSQDDDDEEGKKTSSTFRYLASFKIKKNLRINSQTVFLSKYNLEHKNSFKTLSIQCNLLVVRIKHQLQQQLSDFQ